MVTTQQIQSAIERRDIAQEKVRQAWGEWKQSKSKKEKQKLNKEIQKRNIKSKKVERLDKQRVKQDKERLKKLTKKPAVKKSSKQKIKSNKQKQFEKKLRRVLLRKIKTRKITKPSKRMVVRIPPVSQSVFHEGSWVFEDEWERTKRETDLFLSRDNNAFFWN